MKRLLIAAGLLLPSLFTWAQSFTYTDANGIDFKCRLRDGAVTIKSFTQNAPKVTIPSEVTFQGVRYPVKTIDTYISGNNYSAEHIVISEGIEEIKKAAFVEFRKLTEAQVPQNLMSQTDAAFRRGVRFNHGAQLADLGKEQAPKDERPTPKPEPVAVAVSDIDTRVPTTKTARENTFCVIIANEHYANTAPVDYALNDGDSFRAYCEKTLGIPTTNIRHVKDATFGNMLTVLDFFRNVVDAHPSPQDIQLIFYYSGHGFPSETERETYLLPVDGSPRNEKACLRLLDLYDTLGKMKVKNALVLIDACFSGMQKGMSSAPLMAARGVAIKPRQDKVGGNLVVFSAASEDETAMAYTQQRHGLFTYFLLKELQSSGGDITLGKWAEKVGAQVSIKSVTINDKRQTPWVNVSESMHDVWKDIKL